MIMKHLTFTKMSSLVAKVVAILALGSFAFSAQAQEDAEGSSKGGTLMVGFKGGFNISELITEGGVTQYFIQDRGTVKTLGAQFGAFLRYQANPWLAGDLELGWANQGGRFGGRSLSGNGNAAYTMNTHNFQANLLANVKLPIITTYKPKFFVGPSLNYNFYTHARAEGNEFGFATNAEYDATNSFEAVDFGLVMGIEFEFDLKFAALLIDGRYRHGFNDLNNDFANPFSPSFGESYYNTGASVNLGLGFPIGGK